MTITVRIEHMTPGYDKYIVVRQGETLRAVAPGEATELTLYHGNSFSVHESSDPKQGFMFGLQQQVQIRESGECGSVRARSESVTSEHQYLVRYQAADGRATEQWWDQDALNAN